MVANVKDMFKILGVTRKAAENLLKEHQNEAPEVIQASPASTKKSKQPVSVTSEEKDLAKMMRDVLRF